MTTFRRSKNEILKKSLCDPRDITTVALDLSLDYSKIRTTMVGLLEVGSDQAKNVQLLRAMVADYSQNLKASKTTKNLKCIEIGGINSFLQNFFK